MQVLCQGRGGAHGPQRRSHPGERPLPVPASPYLVRSSEVAEAAAPPWSTCGGQLAGRGGAQVTHAPRWLAEWCARPAAAHLPTSAIFRGALPAVDAAATCVETRPLSRSACGMCVLEGSWQGGVVGCVWGLTAGFQDASLLKAAGRKSGRRYEGEPSGHNLRQLVRGHLRGRARVHLAGDLHFYMRHSFAPYAAPAASAAESAQPDGTAAPDATATPQSETPHPPSQACNRPGGTAGPKGSMRRPRSFDDGFSGTSASSSASSSGSSTPSLANGGGGGGGGGGALRPPPHHARRSASRAASEPPESSSHQRSPSPPQVRLPSGPFASPHTGRWAAKKWPHIRCPIACLAVDGACPIFR